MASKKLIAICQSGGEFETDNDGCMTYNGGEAFAVDLDQQTKLSDFKQELAEIFNYSPNNLLIKYFLPGNRKTLLTVARDKDLKRMVNFFKDSDQVEIYIQIQEAVARDVSNTPPPVAITLPTRSSGTAMFEALVTAAIPVDVPEPGTDICTDMETVTEADPTNAHLDNVNRALDNVNCEKYRRTVMQWENLITGVDQTFSSFIEFREALRKYSIAHGFVYKYKKKDSIRVVVKCKTESCPWRIYASRVTSTPVIRIKRMHMTHTCEGAAFKTAYWATRGLVGSIIKEKLRADPNYKPKDIAIDMKQEFGIDLNYTQARRAKEMAREQLQGSYKDAYSQLPYFCEKIIETNPGSVATFATKEDSSFHRLFVSFHASLSGFRQGCRPLIFLESTTLYSKYRGILLGAVAADGNDDVFPIAFAVVDAETDENWYWFLSELKSALSVTQTIAFVADFRTGLRESLREIFDNCRHGYCLRYLASKLNDDLPREFSHEARRLIVQDFFAAASASTLEAFERCLENIKAISPEAYNWVIRSEPDHWANAFFGGARYNLMTSNFGEVFYSWVSDASELPITQMVDVLRGKMMELICLRRVDSSQWQTRLTPPMEEKLQQEASKARSLQVSVSNGSTFQVIGETVEVVEINHWDCSCKKWQLTGLPCCHAIAVIESLGRSPYDYCSRYFTVESYRLTYAESIHPISNVERSLSTDFAVVAVTVTPPPSKRPPGRPKMKPSGVADIIKRHVQCSKCKGLGHNKKSCKVGNSEQLIGNSEQLIGNSDELVGNSEELVTFAIESSN